ncbi:MAG TPA: LLM class F420-dependent oxidoreductase [Blastocatellia bacterium]
MTNPKPFRFGAQSFNAKSAKEWKDNARKIEALGYSTMLIPDHFSDLLAPISAIMAAADATSTLRIGTLVLDNDYRHPVVLAKEAATIDLLSDGRLELGLGAGWMLTDYDQSGIPYDPVGTRIDRFEEGLAIIKRLFGDGPVSFSGKHYKISSLEGTPKPVQKPHPPILIGGGGKRILSIAAREADIVNVNFSMTAGAIVPEATATGSAEATAEKIKWLRSKAGDLLDQKELSVTVFATVITDNRQVAAEQIAPRFGAPPEMLLSSPHVLIGTVDSIVEELQRRREIYGFSYVIFSGGVSGDVFDSIAPVVSRLNGK